MTTASVTCIVPTHNRDSVLLKALESIRSQTRQPEAVVVVDDVASASTRRLVTGFRGLPNITYLDNSGTQHRGASSSRNAGARLATTTHLAFLDDDDRWEPEFLAECLSAFDGTGAALVTAAGTVEVGDARQPRPWLAKRQLTSAQCVAWNPGITGSSFVISTSAFRDIAGFDDQLPVFNDLDFFVRFLARDHRYAVVRRPLFIQTADGAEHLSSRSERRARGIETYMAKHRNGLRWHHRRRLVREIHLARRYEGQTAALRAYHFAFMWLHSSPRQLVEVVRSKVSRHERMYV
ncbi:MAG: hypothetical protein JWQ75_2021 [Pseudarthrobacter sp.]|nr:hypothetical protein [Pseudarthrobacter sp.]